MNESTFRICRSDIAGHYMSNQVPQYMRDRIACGLAHPLFQNVEFFIYHDRKSGNFYRVERI